MSEKIDWTNLGFRYIQTDSYVRCDYANGEWSDIQVCTDPHVTLHIAATCLHYGQAVFEGLSETGREDRG